MSDLVERLREQITSDHTRGCQGRCYSCDCGYDLATEGLLEQAATALEAKDKELEALRALRDMLILCGELGGMQPSETAVQYLRRLIDHIGSTENERLDEAKENVSLREQVRLLAEQRRNLCTINNNSVSELKSERIIANGRVESAERRVKELEGMLSPESDHPTRNVGLLYQQARAETAEQKVKQAEACCDSYADENRQLHARLMTAERERDQARAALKQISDGYGPNHGSKFCRDVAARAVIEKDKTNG